MEHLRVYFEKDIEDLTRTRAGEIKVGQKVACTSSDWKKDLLASGARFVLLGIAEDIGVRANFGRPGAATAVKPAFDSILNQQHNVWFNAENLFVLGEIEVQDLMLKAQDLNQKNQQDLKRLRELTSEVDTRLIPIIQTIIAANKIPIVIGGGHNNAYGNIVGAALAKAKAVNVINCDPHLDFRLLEGRHSGNGFSYAFEEKYLNKYAVLGMHEQYNNESSLDTFIKHPQQLYYQSYESIFVRGQMSFSTALERCIAFVKDSACGIEIDSDAITNVPSSAKTSSGLSPIEARQYVYTCASNLEVLYFHIAEAAPVLSHIKADNKTGKLIAYLVTDFMKGVLEPKED
jgi:formiminoglutamase